MAAAIKQIVTVGPGGTIEIPRSTLAPGTKVEVTVSGITSENVLRNVDQLEAFRELQKSMNLTREQAERWVADNNRSFRGKPD